MHSNWKVLQKSEEEEGSLFPPPVRIALRRWKDPPLGFPLPEHRTEQRDGCTLVKSCKRQPAFWTELASVPRFHGCPGQCEKGVVKIRLIEQVWGGVRQNTCLHGQEHCFAAPKADSSLMAEMCVANLQSLYERPKICHGLYLYFINSTKVGVLCVFSLRHQ